MNKENIWEIRGIISYIKELCEDTRLTMRERFEEIEKIFK